MRILIVEDEPKVDLGLALAEWAVRSAGGRIEVESVEGAGSTFRIVLPRPQAPANGVETRT